MREMERTSGVWCETSPPHNSAERIIAERVLSYFDMNPSDFRERDPLIMDISHIVTSLMDGAANSVRRMAKRRKALKKAKK